MTTFHLPLDLGDLPSKLGDKDPTDSFSVVTSRSETLPTAKVFPPTDPEKKEAIAKPTSETTSDAFGLNRVVKSSALFQDISNYDLNPDQWSFRLADTTISPTQESVVWTNRNNVLPSYTGTLPQVKFSPTDSSIQLSVDPVNSNLGQQQVVLFSNRNFSAAVSPIFVTMAVKMTLSSNVNCVKTWGWLGGDAGYFFRIKGDGQDNNFVIGYRYSLGGATTEVEITRSNFNGDKLDGAGTSVHAQTFTNIGMFGIEVGTAGYGARFWAYVSVNNGLPRWVLVHALANDSDSSPNRLIDEENLPFTFEIRNQGFNTQQTLNKYGTSVASIGAAEGNVSLSLAEGINKTILTTKHYQYLIGFRSAPSVLSKRNFNSILATQFVISALGKGLKTISIIRNPEQSITTLWQKNEGLSGVEFSTDRQDLVIGGEILASFMIGRKPIVIDLADIFRLNRTFSTSRYAKNVQLANEFEPQIFLGSDEFWICIKDSSADLDYITWEVNETVNCQVTYPDNDYIKFQSIGYSRQSLINVNVNIVEV